MFSSTLRVMASSINSFRRRRKFTQIQGQHRRWFFKNREVQRVKLFFIIYTLTIINGIIFDSILICPLGILFLLNLIALLNDELTGLTYKCITKLLFPNIDISYVYWILYECRIFVNFIIVLTVLSVSAVVYTGMGVYLTWHCWLTFYFIVITWFRNKRRFGLVRKSTERIVSFFSFETNWLSVWRKEKWKEFFHRIIKRSSMISVWKTLIYSCLSLYLFEIIWEMKFFVCSDIYELGIKSIRLNYLFE
jgi:hypothetical protein